MTNMVSEEDMQYFIVEALKTENAVVHCKDCRHAEETGMGNVVSCRMMEHMFPTCFYCAAGERRMNNERC